MTDQVVVAPEVLGLEERDAFRRAALETLSRMRDGASRLVVDLRVTRTLDSAGLGTLLVIQRLAAERRIPTVLRDPSSEVRFLLMVTRLDGLFELDPPATGDRG